jgi:hypothetical protein
VGKFLLVVVVFAALVYGVMWLLERRRVGMLHAPRRARPTRRAIAPDDDEEFLRDLGRRRPTDQDPSD